MATKNKKKNQVLDRKSFTFLVAILAVVVVILVAKRIHNGNEKSYANKDKNQVGTEAVTEGTEVKEEETIAKELEKGNFVMEPHTDGQNFTKDSVVYFDYKAKYYTVASGKCEKEVIDLINHEINYYMEHKKADILTTEADAKELYETTYKNEGKDNAKSYQYEINAKLLRNDESVFSLVIYTASYCGGQHGSSESYCMNFDAKTGKLLDMPDLMSPLSSASAEAFENDILEMIYEKAEEKKEEQGLFDDYQSSCRDVFLNNHSWALTAEGLQFVADPYEIAPYASGMIVYSIPTEKIKWFNEDYAFSAKKSK